MGKQKLHSWCDSGKRGIALTALMSLAAGAGFAQDKPAAKTDWVIHEWGTFTSLQDENGATIGGINTDDEPLPKFVHRLSDWILIPPTQVPIVFFQGAPHCHPDVTMRLETPVIYFHPSAGVTNERVNVKVKFKGGWLTEFYPNAGTNALAVRGSAFGMDRQFDHLTTDTVGSLDWENLEVGVDGAGRVTDYHVWNAPRMVRAASVRTQQGETEKFLFYRGVGHIDAPLKISREEGTLVIRSQLNEGMTAKPLPIHFLWLVDIQPGGKVAFRKLPPIALEGEGNKILASTEGEFKKADYRAGSLEKLKTALRTTLIDEGLFADEADALLNTWELSYFKSAGMRVFFIVPREWTDHYLPLDISVGGEINRVMVGRIELVTPGQREILREMGEYSQDQINKDWQQLHENFYGAIGRLSQTKEYAQVDDGAESLEAAGVGVPGTYRKYLELGRFRNTLVLDEVARRPTEGLKNFVQSYGLEGYNVRQAEKPK